MQMGKFKAKETDEARDTLAKGIVQVMRQKSVEDVPLCRNLKH